MGSIEGRLKRLEAKANPGSDPEGYSGTAAETREIDGEIARLEAAIAEAEASMTPEEFARERGGDAALTAHLEGLPLDEKIVALEAAIVEAELEEEEEHCHGKENERWRSR